jgi:hypothetical protein
MCGKLRRKIVADEFQFWRDALAGKSPPMDANTPQPGYYRKRAHKSGPWIPVAIWRKNGDLVARVGDKWDSASEIWTWVAGNPVSKNDAKYAFENGNIWPTDTESIANYPPGNMDSKTELLAIIDQARTWAKDPPEPDAITKDVADLAANFDDRVVSVEKAAKVQRDEEFKPILQEIERLKKLQSDLKISKAEWKDLFDKVPKARGVLKDVYVTWQRHQSLAGGDTKCGGQYANRKSYIVKNDPLHPDTIKAREAAEAAELERAKAAKRVQDELDRKAEEKRQADILAEAERIKKEKAERPVPEPVAEPDQVPQELPLSPPPKGYEHVITDMQAVMAWALDQDHILEIIRSEALKAARNGTVIPGIEEQEKVTA